jgi:hypothetical protein
VIALALAACQPQASAKAIPSSSPAAPPGDLIYVQDPSAPQMLEMDWFGKVHGSVSARGFSTPSPDGSRFFRTTDHIIVEDWRGHALGALDADANSYGLGTWADDGQHFCGITFPANSGPDAGMGSLWITAPGEKSRAVGPVGKPGSDPAVAACSIKNNRAIVAGGLEPHWPPGATRYLITGEIQVVNLSTGAIEYEHQYPLGNLGGQRETGTRGDWVLVVASPDGRYLAETGVFNGKTTIREVPTGKPLATLLGSVRGFSWDGSRVAASVSASGTTETKVISWTDQRVIWHGSGVAQSAVARPGFSDLLIGRAGTAGDWYDLVVVRADGTSAVVVQNGMIRSSQRG